MPERHEQIHTSFHHLGKIARTIMLGAALLGGAEATEVRPKKPQSAHTLKKEVLKPKKIEVEVVQDLNSFVKSLNRDLSSNLTVLFQTLVDIANHLAEKGRANPALGKDENYLKLLGHFQLIGKATTLPEAEKAVDRVIGYCLEHGYLFNIMYSEARGASFMPVHEVIDKKLAIDQGLTGLFPEEKLLGTASVSLIADENFDFMGGNFYGHVFINQERMKSRLLTEDYTKAFTGSLWENFTLKDLTDVTVSNELAHAILRLQYNFDVNRKILWNDGTDAYPKSSQEAFEFFSDVASMARDPRYVYANIDRLLEGQRDAYGFSSDFTLKLLLDIFKKHGKEKEFVASLTPTSKAEKFAAIKMILHTIDQDDLNYLRDAFRKKGKSLLALWEGQEKGKK